MHTSTKPKTPKPQDAVVENQASTHHTQAAISVAFLPSMTLLHHLLKKISKHTPDVSCHDSETNNFASSNRATNGEPIRKGTFIVAPLTHQDSFL